MIRSTRRVVLAALLPALCACSTFSSWRRSAHAVTPRFAWPEPFSARVSYSFTMNSPLGNTEVHRRYWLLEEPAKDKGVRRLVPRDIEVFPPQYAAMVDPVPTVRFDHEGAFLGIESPEELPGQRMLEALPMGEETLVSARGQNLSSGQRQLIILTAAFASSRPVLLLDEATSQMDDMMRRRCQWDLLVQGRTVVRVEHG